MNFGNYEYEFQKPDCFIITCSSVPRKNPVDKKKLPILIDKVLISSDGKGQCMLWGFPAGSVIDSI